MLLSRLHSTVSVLLQAQQSSHAALSRRFRVGAAAGVVWLCCASWLTAAGEPPAAAPLPGTRRLEWPEEDLSERMMDGAHALVERKIDEAADRRGRFWQYDWSDPAAYAASVEPNRQRLREIIGAVDPRPPIRLERFGDDRHPALAAEGSTHRVYQVRWPVVEDVWAEGLLAEPLAEPAAGVVVLPDADQTPEQLLGLAPGIEPQQQFARRLAENGVLVVLPTLVARQPLETDDRQLAGTDQTWREWIYRQAFHMGRHPIGYEVQAVQAAADWLSTRCGRGKLGAAGYAEGGLIAFYAAALDPRFDAALVSGYFDCRQRVWSEPIYRNVWSLLQRFGDAEIASLILPRGLVIEHSSVPPIRGHKGDWQTPGGASVRAEFARIPGRAGFGHSPALIIGDGDRPLGPGSPAALKEFTGLLGIELTRPLDATPPADRRGDFDPGPRQRRIVRQLERHIQGLVRQSEHVRDQWFLYRVMPELAQARWTTERSLPVHDAERFVELAREYRERFHTEAMGHFDEPLLAPGARTRKILENDRWTAYDVVLDVWPELFAWGALVVPQGIAPGERRPVVVCQHGRNGLPRDTIDRESSAYNQFAARLAERGFVTFAPHNLYRGEDRYRWLDRKANAVQASLFSFIIAQHDQLLRWLPTLPFVDGSRIAFYGLSYGGETAVRVPPILEGYCLSICSGDFNQWTRKVAATDQQFSFMRTIEWEMPYWNLGHTFDYAEMSYLMLPRPLMVERGHLDLVGRDAWVAHEYTKVRWLYAQLGLAERTEIEFFQGGHSIHGVGTFEFLHKHLDWPPPR